MGDDFRVRRKKCLMALGERHQIGSPGGPQVRRDTFVIPE
jgi:hypothetical protein